MTNFDAILNEFRTFTKEMGVSVQIDQVISNKQEVIRQEGIVHHHVPDPNHQLSLQGADLMKISRVAMRIIAKGVAGLVPGLIHLKEIIKIIEKKVRIAMVDMRLSVIRIL